MIKHHSNREQTLFGVKEKSNWTPKYVDHTVETFVAAIKRDFENSTLKKQPKDNLTPGKRKALHDFQMRDDIIITKADKGGATVIWDVKDYLKEAENNLIIKHSTKSWKPVLLKNIPDL